jgi:hypothetical protein
MAWQKRANALADFPPGSASGGDSYGIILQLQDVDSGSLNWSDIHDVLTKKPPTYGVDRNKLYRIRRFENGEMQPKNKPDEGDDDGQLSTDQLLFDRVAMKTDLENRTPKFTGYAFQIGLGRVQNYEKVGSKITMPQGRGKLNGIRESRKMVEEINDILDQ